MKKYGLTARRKKKRYVYPGEAAQIAPKLLREMKEESISEARAGLSALHESGWHPNG